MKRSLLLLSLFCVSTLSFGEEKKFNVVSSVPIELHGGASGAYFWTNNTGTSSDEDDKIQLSNGILQLNGEFGNKIKLSFDLALGTVLVPTLWDGGQNDPVSYSFSDGSVSKDGFGLIWGYASFQPFKGISVDAGVLPTNVGYEVANTYANPNITLGTIWYAQPVIYEGIRLSFDLNEIANIPFGFYAEYNQEFNTDNYALGVNGEFSGVSFALNYYDYRANKNLIDVVLGYTISNVDLGLNFDWQWLDDSAKQPGQDDNAWGVALYFIPKFETARGEVSVPVRLEYFDEGTSGIYSGSEQDNNGWSITVTPTYRPTPNTFVRVEYAYLNTDKKVINGEDNKTTLSAEIGFTF
ncbi:outer membrane beta-barrel protein [Aquifex pyrophilus]